MQAKAATLNSATTCPFRLLVSLAVSIQRLPWRRETNQSCCSQQNASMENPMKPSKLYEALHALIGERVPLHIWGACGGGELQIVAQST